MKRVFVGLFIILLAAVSSFSAFATGSTTYHLDDVGMSIDIPDGFIVFTRDINQNDPNLSKIGLTKSELSSLMENSYSYLYAIDSDLNEITVTMAKGASVEYYSTTKDSALLSEASTIVDEFKEMGLTVTKYDVYSTDQTKYIKFFSNRPSNLGTVYILQYSTSLGTTKINISLKSYSSSITSTKESLLEGIVDSVVYKISTTPTTLPTNSPSGASNSYSSSSASNSYSSSSSHSYSSYSSSSSGNSSKWKINWITVIGIALWALIPGFIAKSKKRSFWGYYFLSFIITPLISMIIAICLDRKAEESPNMQSNAVATIDSVQSAEASKRGKSQSYEVVYLIYFEYGGKKYSSTYSTNIKYKEDINRLIGKKLNGFYNPGTQEFTCIEGLDGVSGDLSQKEPKGPSDSRFSKTESEKVSPTSYLPSQSADKRNESVIILKSENQESDTSRREFPKDPKMANQPLSYLSDSNVIISTASDSNQLPKTANKQLENLPRRQEFLNDGTSDIPGMSDVKSDFSLEIPQGHEVLFESDPMEVQGGLPVLIEKIALLKDSSSGSLPAYFLFQNLSNKPIIAMMLDISCRDIWGSPTSDVNGFQILDLAAKKGEHFSNLLAAPIPDPSTRWIDVSIKKIVFSDRTIAEGTDEKFELPKQITLQAFFNSRELAEEYIRETASPAIYAPVIGQSHWRCICGEINPNSETSCSKCGALLSQITSALDREALTRSINLRKEEERLKAERAAEEERRREEEKRIRAEKERRESEERERIAEERRRAFEEEEERRRRIAEEELKKRKEKDRIKRRKILFGILGAVFVLFLVYAAIWHVVPYIKYVRAGDLKANKQYDEAYEAYEALGDFSDSAEMALNTKYAKAKDLMDGGEYLQAAAIFDWLGDYWNSKTCADYCRNKADYVSAVGFYKSGRYIEAIDIFQRLSNIGFEDSFEYLLKSRYGFASGELEKGHYEVAISQFESLGTYSDSTEMVKECKYQRGKAWLNNGDFKRGYDELILLTNYKDAHEIAIEAKYQYGMSMYREGKFDDAYEALIDLNYYKDVSGILTEVKYEHAVSLANRHVWKDAYPIFQNLGDYKDSADRYKSSYYEYGLGLITSKQYTSAVNVFKNLGYYKDSASQVNRAKYFYVLAHKNNTDTTTFSYLKDLKAIWYEDSTSIYKELYAWGIQVLAFNNTDGNNTSKLTRVKKSSSYTHFTFKLTGGAPDDKTKISTYSIYPNGSIGYMDGSWDDARRGYQYTTYWNDLGYYSGTMTVRVYIVNTGEVIGEYKVTLY